jgi:TfoX/Sxy family transcriptional regulator of competence genes
MRSELGKPQVSPGTGFGTNKGLRVSGKIYAILVGGELVVKLPAERVTSLMASGAGKPFGAGRAGRVMKEWVTVPDSASRRWRTLVEDARQFVGGSA